MASTSEPVFTWVGGLAFYQTDEAWTPAGGPPGADGIANFVNSGTVIGDGTADAMTVAAAITVVDTLTALATTDAVTVGSGATLTVLGALDASGSAASLTLIDGLLEFATDGAAEIGGSGQLAGSTLLLDAGGVIVGSGTIGSAQSGTVVVGTTAIPSYGLDITGNGTVVASGGRLVIDADVVGRHMLQVDNGATLVLGGTVGAGNTVSFVGAGPHILILDNPTGFAGTITGFEIGDQIILSNTSSANQNGVVAASIGTLGTLGGVQTLQILESKTNNPTSILAPIDFAVQGSTAGGALTGDYFQVSQGSGSAATTLTLAQGNPLALSIGATQAQQTYGVTGKGIVVGIVSDSFNLLSGQPTNAANIVLPGFTGPATGEDEGGAMADIIRDIAPGVTIEFASGIASPTAEANAIAALVANGSQIIVDDVSFDPTVDPPGGPIALAISAAVRGGVTFITSADNFRQGGPYIYGQANNPLALSVAAMNILATPSPVGGYIVPQTEPFSSIGTLTDMGTLSYIKPDITGPDGVATGLPLYPTNANNPFFGTSAAAAAVAGVAALMMQANPALATEPSVVDQLLEGSATPFQDASDLGSTHAQTEGAGLVNAEAAVGEAENYVACFVQGTRILTTRGAIAVERLTLGEAVITASGATRPIQWLGYRKLNTWHHPCPESVCPVRVCADAFADGQPLHDLFLSPDHAVFVDGVLIPIQYLINGATIFYEKRREVRYWHVELDRHDVILAEGLPCESYLDTGNRRVFANATGEVLLHPHFGPLSWDSACAPLCVAGVHLAHARQRVLTRLEARGFCSTCVSPHVEARGKIYLPVDIVGNLHRFFLPAGTGAVCLSSEASVPAWVDPHSADYRSLGVRIDGIVVNSRVLSLNSPALGHGFYPVEQKGRVRWRWTNGAGILAVGEGKEPLALELLVGHLPTYWVGRLADTKRQGEHISLEGDKELKLASQP